MLCHRAIPSFFLPTLWFCFLIWVLKYFQHYQHSKYSVTSVFDCNRNSYCGRLFYSIGPKDSIIYYENLGGKVWTHPGATVADSYTGKSVTAETPKTCNYLKLKRVDCKHEYKIQFYEVTLFLWFN